MLRAPPLVRLVVAYGEQLAAGPDYAGDTLAALEPRADDLRERAAPVPAHELVVLVVEHEHVAVLRADQAARALRDRGEHAFFVERLDQVERGRVQRAQLAVAPLELALRLLALGDVLVQDDHADDLAVRVSQRRRGCA